MPGDGVAWIVAIEKYAESALKLEAVGLWALDLAELMVKLELPKIVLSTSLFDVPAYAPRIERLKEKGVVLTGAARSDIENALNQIKGAGALLLYWAGHGIMAPARQLICADSRRSDLRTLKTDELLTKLRSADYPRLQLGFFECCAQVMSGETSPLGFSGGGAATTRQFFYHASSPAETASATKSKSGFSTTVLLAMGALQTFPPDPVPFFDELKIALGKLPLQTRPFLERTEEAGDRWSSGDPNRPPDAFDAANVAGLSQSQFLHLWRTVRGTLLKPVELARAWNRGKLQELIADLAAKEPFSTAPESLEKAAAQLELQIRFEPLCLRLGLLLRDWLAVYDRFAADGLAAAKPEAAGDLACLILAAIDKPAPDNSRRSLIRFLLLAISRVGRQSAEGEKLRQALIHDPGTAPFYDSVRAALPAEGDTLYLLLDVDWDGEAQAASLVKAWIYPGLLAAFDPRPVSSEGKLSQQIEAVVQKVIDEFPTRQLLVELLSPNQLLSTPRKLLEVIDPDIDTCTWLEAEQAITLRWRDRMRGKHKFGFWRQSWESLWDSACNATSLSCAWRPGADPELEYHVVGLTIPGPCPDQPRRNSTEFFGELDKGAPYMCWPRDPVLNVEEFRKAVETFLAGAKLKSLPLALKKTRSDPLLRELVVLIDEPERNPHAKPGTLTETPQRGSNDA